MRMPMSCCLMLACFSETVWTFDSLLEATPLVPYKRMTPRSFTLSSILSSGQFLRTLVKWASETNVVGNNPYSLDWMMPSLFDRKNMGLCPSTSWTPTYGAPLWSKACIAFSGFKRSFLTINIGAVAKPRDGMQDNTDYMEMDSVF